jgi:hypothetical protein
MTPERRAVVAVVGAVLVLVVVAVIILVFGVIPLPDYPALAEQPDQAIPGTVAYMDYRDEPCIYTVPASGGEPRETWCGREYIEFPAWNTDGLLVVTDWTAEPVYVLIDPATGQEVDQVPIGDLDELDARPLPYPGPSRQDRADGARLLTEGIRGGKSAVVVRTDGQDLTILSIEDAPSDYRFYEAQWSPDGDWVLVSDTEGRLLIVGADGTPSARILVDGLDEWGPQAAWYIPGNDTYTVDIPGR